MTPKPADPDGSPPSDLVSLSTEHGLPRPMEAYWTTKDVTTLRYAHWQTAKSTRLGSLLFLNGRTDFIEKTIETYAALVRSGLDLWTLDWRGQGLSARALNDPQKGHVLDYQCYLDDLDQFVREVTDLPTQSGKRLMLSHSMGGHIGLRYLHDHPGLIDKAVFLAPMINISVNRESLRAINRMINVLGFGKTYALGTGRFKPIFENPEDPNDNGTIEDYRALLPLYEELSRDPRLRAEAERYVRNNKALALGGPTAAWLDATFRSINLTLKPGYPESIQTPILLIGGGRDQTVMTADQKRLADRLPHGDFRLIESGGHELLMECPVVRQKVFEAFS
ncbi:MAG: alpha/beta fold hydrolase, partial [Geminicoccaceae bacterium]